MERIRIDRTRQTTRQSAAAASTRSGKGSFKSGTNQDDGRSPNHPVDASRHPKEAKQRSVGFTSEVLAEFTPPDVRSRRGSGLTPDDKALPHVSPVKVNPLTAHAEGAKSAEKEEIGRPRKSSSGTGVVRTRRSSSIYDRRGRTRPNVEPSGDRPAWMSCAQAADLLTTVHDAWKLAVQAVSLVQSVEELLSHSYGNSAASDATLPPTPLTVDGVSPSTNSEASSSSLPRLSPAPSVESARGIESVSQGLPTLAGGGGVGLGRDLCLVLALHVDVALRLEAAHALADHRARLNQHLDASSAATWKSAARRSSSSSSSPKKPPSSRLEAAAAAALLPLAAEANLLVATARSLVLPLLLVDLAKLSQAPAENSTSETPDSWSVAIRSDWCGFVCACAVVESSGPGLFYRGKWNEGLAFRMNEFKLMASLLAVATDALPDDRGSAAPVPEAARAAAAATLGAFGSTFFLLKESAGKESGNSEVDDVFQLAVNKLPHNEASRLTAAAAELAAAEKPAGKIKAIVKGSSGSSFRLSGIMSRRYINLRRGSSSNGASNNNNSGSSRKSFTTLSSASKSNGGEKVSLASVVHLLLQQQSPSVRACGVRTAERLVMGYHEVGAEAMRVESEAKRKHAGAEAIAGGTVTPPVPAPGGSGHALASSESSPGDDVIQSEAVAVLDAMAAWLTAAILFPAPRCFASSANEAAEGPKGPHLGREYAEGGGPAGSGDGSTSASASSTSSSSSSSSIVDGLIDLRSLWEGSKPSPKDFLAAIEALARLATNSSVQPEQQPASYKELLAISSRAKGATLLPSPKFVSIFMYFARGEDHLSSTTSPSPCNPTRPDPELGAASAASQTQKLEEVNAVPLLSPRVRRAAVAILAAYLPSLCARAAAHRAAYSAATTADSPSDGVMSPTTAISVAVPSVSVHHVADVLRACLESDADATVRFRAYYGLVKSGLSF